MSHVRDRAAETLAEILRLPVEEVRTDGSPLDLPGFDSIVAMELLERLETELDAEVPPELIVPEAFESLDALAALFARPLQEVDA